MIVLCLQPSWDTINDGIYMFLGGTVLTIIDGRSPGVIAVVFSPILSCVIYSHMVLCWKTLQEYMMLRLLNNSALRDELWWFCVQTIELLLLSFQLWYCLAWYIVMILLLTLKVLLTKTFSQEFCLAWWMIMFLHPKTYFGGYIDLLSCFHQLKLSIATYSHICAVKDVKSIIDEEICLQKFCLASWIMFLLPKTYCCLLRYCGCIVGNIVCVGSRYKSIIDEKCSQGILSEVLYSTAFVLGDFQSISDVILRNSAFCDILG